jgi:hypothetical protein
VRGTREASGFAEFALGRAVGPVGSGHPAEACEYEEKAMPYATVGTENSAEEVNPALLAFLAK